MCEETQTQNNQIIILTYLTEIQNDLRSPCCFLALKVTKYYHRLATETLRMNREK